MGVACRSICICRVICVCLILCVTNLRSRAWLLLLLLLQMSLVSC